MNFRLSRETFHPGKVSSHEEEDYTNEMMVTQSHRIDFAQDHHDGSQFGYLFNSTMHFPSSALNALVLIAVLATFPTADAAACKTVTTWNMFVNFVNTAMNEKQSEICFNPFEVSKPTNSRLVLNRPITLRCQKTKTSDKCAIEGAGHQIRIAGGNSQVLMEGFTFVGATNCAVRIVATSAKMHTLVDCDFIE